MASKRTMNDRSLNSSTESVGAPHKLIRVEEEEGVEGSMIMAPKTPTHSREGRSGPKATSTPQLDNERFIVPETPEKKKPKKGGSKNEEKHRHSRSSSSSRSKKDGEEGSSKKKKKNRKHSKSRTHTDGGLLNFQKWKSLITAPGALFLLTLRIATGIPIGVFQSMFQVVALETFKLPADQNGYLMSYIGILTMIVQGVGVGILLKKTSEQTILKWASFILVWSYLSLAFVGSITQLCVVMAPLVVGLASQNIVISSALTKTVEAVDTGAMLGLSMATNSLIRTVSPTVGGIMLENFGFPSFGYLGFISSGLVTAMLFFKFSDKS